MIQWKYAQSMFSPCRRDGDRIFLNKGIGAYIYDEDGKQYIDFWNGFGSVLLGYNNEEINSGVRQLLSDQAFSLHAPTRYLDELHSLLLEDYPSKNQIALFNSGTSAVRAAALIAKRYTGKDIILSSGYHGWDPMWEMSDIPFTPNQYSVVDFFYILEKLDEMVHAYRNRIAAVIISPDLSYFTEEYYKRLDNICRQNNIFVIVDDVKAGYRYNIGPSLNPNVFTADIYVVSKGIANGAKISCVIGDNSVLQTGKDFCYTSFYDVYAVLTAICTLKTFKTKMVQESIRAHGDSFIEKASNLITESRLPILIKGNGNLFQFILFDEYLSKAFYSECVEQGIICYEGDNQCLSYAFKDEERAESLNRIQNVLNVLRKEFKSYIGLTVPWQRIYETAYNQIDGCIENMSVEEKHEFVMRLFRGSTR